MKKVLTAIAISMSALMATSAMAANNDYRDNNHQNSTWNNAANDHRNTHGNDKRFDRNDRDNNRYNSSVNPSHQWRTGQTLPRQYSSSRYQVNGSTLKRLPKAGRNQQWYKIGGDYVLVNERNDKILKIMG